MFCDKYEEIDLDIFEFFEEKSKSFRGVFESVLDTELFSEDGR